MLEYEIEIIEPSHNYACKLECAFHKYIHFMHYPTLLSYTYLIEILKTSEKLCATLTCNQKTLNASLIWVGCTSCILLCYQQGAVIGVTICEHMHTLLGDNTVSVLASTNTRGFHSV